MKLDTKDIAHEIMKLSLKPDNPMQDNLAIMLCTYFEDSSDNPQNGEMDEHDTWSQWTADQVDLIEKKIVEILEKYV